MCCSINKFSRHFFGGLLDRSASPRRKGGGALSFSPNAENALLHSLPYYKLARSFTWGRQLGKGGFGNVSVLLACFSSLVVEERGSKDLDLSRPKTKKNRFQKKKHFFNFRSALSSTSATAPSSPASPSQNASTPRGSRRSGRRPTSTTSGGRSRCCGGCAARSTSWRWRARSRTRTLPTS